MAARPIPEISLGQLMREMDAETRRVPLQGTIEPTFRCNLDCVHCYVNEPAASAEAREREVDTARLLALVDEIAEAGCLSLLLTGGEVLLRRDFPEVYRHAVTRGMRVTVFTNGTMVTEEVARLFEALPPRSVEITLYGMTADTYERVTRVPGSFARCLEGIDRLLARGIRVKLKTMALAWNAHEIPAMRAFAREKGCEFQHDGILNPRVDCGASRAGELRLSPEEVVALDLDDPVLAARLKESCDEALAAAAAAVAAGADPTPADEPLYSCGAGRNTFTVDPYGALQLCQLSRRGGYDLRAGTFREGWDEHLPRLRARGWRSNSVCRSCSLASLCASCPGAAELEHGDPEAVVGHFCRITHHRTFVLAGDAPGHRADASCCLDAATQAAGAALAAEPTGAAPLIQIARRKTPAAPARPPVP